MVSKVNNVEEERIACNGVLITRRILLASGTCIYENFKLYKHDYAFIYNDQLMKIIIDENNIFFNENLSRNFDPSLRNFALIINKEEMNPQYAIEYFYHFARNDDKINFTDCVVQTPSDLTTLDEAHSCMSSEYSDTINRVKNVNKINCPNIDSLWCAVSRAAENGCLVCKEPLKWCSSLSVRSGAAMRREARRVVAEGSVLFCSVPYTKPNSRAIQLAYNLYVFYAVNEPTSQHILEIYDVQHTTYDVRCPHPQI
ncbi:uncharacterized protein LOC123260110 [Cotesia glomerata]|uniref:uncharacterized protein LOC123260110 n=1 Tax=Cotesia glomerata TaxID=32391 RepID=UPI001D005C94|nr:uncharacterized protein LOC123260110 [Cotesia glomerata]